MATNLSRSVYIWVIQPFQAGVITVLLTTPCSAVGGNRFKLFIEIQRDRLDIVDLHPQLLLQAEELNWAPSSAGASGFGGVWQPPGSECWEQLCSIEEIYGNNLFSLSLTISMKELKQWQQHAMVSGLVWGVMLLSPGPSRAVQSGLSLSSQPDWFCCRATHPAQFRLLLLLLLPGEESSLKGPVCSHWHDNDCTGLEWNSRWSAARLSAPSLS